MSEPLFFFSYARADRSGAGNGLLRAQDSGPGNSVDQFYNNLCDEVAALTGLRSADVGYYDVRNLELGALWPKDLMEALQSALVMVALFSPTYFSRWACGREFQVFRRRHEALTKSLGRMTESRVLPVLWVRPDITYDAIPVCCRDYITNLQNTAPGMPESYKSLGLRRMFEREENRNTNIVCQTIADRIFDFWRKKEDERPPKIDESEFHAIDSAFHLAATGRPRPIDPMKREIRVYYLVPTHAEWSAESGASDCDFEDQREQARPFRNARGATIRSATEEGIALVNRGLGIAHEPLPKDLASALTDADIDESHTTPLVVFDRRAVRVDNLKTAAVSYAARNFKNTGFVTVAGQDVTESEVDTVFAAKKGALPKLHNWMTPEKREDYVGNVASIVFELEAELVRRKAAKKPPLGPPPPGLSGPGAG